MKTFSRDNGLTIALAVLFLFSALGMIWSGHSAYNEELQHHGLPAIGLLAYLTSGDFLSALFENWESEFLQMSAYVILTAMLFQRGSAESRDPDDPDRPIDQPGPHEIDHGPVGLPGDLRRDPGRCRYGRHDRPGPWQEPVLSWKGRIGVGRHEPGAIAHRIGRVTAWAAAVASPRCQACSRACASAANPMLAKYLR